MHSSSVSRRRLRNPHARRARRPAARALRMSFLTPPKSPNMKCRRSRLNTRSIFWPSATVCKARGRERVRAGTTARPPPGTRTRGGCTRLLLRLCERSLRRSLPWRGDTTARVTTGRGERQTSAPPVPRAVLLAGGVRALSPILTKKVALASSASRTSVSPRLATASDTLQGLRGGGCTAVRRQ
jgi:hypothetical protein